MKNRATTYRSLRSSISDRHEVESSLYLRFKKESTMNFETHPTANLLAACVFALVLLVGAADAQQKPCPTASKFGPDDQVGNVKYITPAKTLAATKLVTKGKAYRLGIETNKDTPAYGTRTFAITVLQPGQAGGTSLGPTKRPITTTSSRAGSGSVRKSMALAMPVSTVSILIATRPPTLWVPMASRN